MQDETMKTSVKEVYPMLVKRLKLEGLDEENKKEILQHMTEAIVKRVMVEAYDNLENDVDKELFANLMDENNPPEPEQVDDFLNEKLGYNYKRIMFEAIDELEQNIKEEEINSFAEKEIKNV